MDKKLNILIVLAVVSISLGIVTLGTILFSKGYLRLSSQQAQVCRYQGEAKVTEGIHAGLKLEGNLYVVSKLNARSRITGNFYVQGNPLGDGTKIIKMDGTIKSGRITMNFKMPKGAGTILGTGDFPAEAAECKGTVEGLLSGPARDDRGDWRFNVEPATTCEGLEAELTKCELNESCFYSDEYSNLYFEYCSKCGGCSTEENA